LRDLTWEKKLLASFVYDDGKKKFCVLTEKGNADPKKAVNFTLISKGLAKVDRPVEVPAEVDKLYQEEEDVVSEKKTGIWGTLELEDNDDE